MFYVCTPHTHTIYGIVTDPIAFRGYKTIKYTRNVIFPLCTVLRVCFM